MVTRHSEWLLWLNSQVNYDDFLIYKIVLDELTSVDMSANALRGQVVTDGSDVQLLLNSNYHEVVNNQIALPKLETFKCRLNNFVTTTKVFLYGIF